MNNKDSYQQRLLVQTGEDLFEKWALDKGYIATCFGSNARDNPIPNYSRLNPILRNAPDYILNMKGKTYVVSVKGTKSIKLSEIMLLDDLVKAYSSDKAPFIYAFCLKGQEPVLMSPETLEKRFDDEENKAWHDGVLYRTIRI